MTNSLATGLRLVCECLELAIADIETDEKQQALHHIQIARQRLQELEIDLFARINAGERRSM